MSVPTTLVSFTLAFATLKGLSALSHDESFWVVCEDVGLFFQTEWRAKKQYPAFLHLRLDGLATNCKVEHVLS